MVLWHNYVARATKGPKRQPQGHPQRRGKSDWQRCRKRKEEGAHCQTFVGRQHRAHRPVLCRFTSHHLAGSCAGRQYKYLCGPAPGRSSEVRFLSCFHPSLLSFPSYFSAVCPRQNSGISPPILARTIGLSRVSEPQMASSFGRERAVRHSFLASTAVL